VSHTQQLFTKADLFMDTEEMDTIPDDEIIKYNDEIILHAWRMKIIDIANYYKLQIINKGGLVAFQDLQLAFRVVDKDLEIANEINDTPATQALSLVREILSRLENMAAIDDVNHRPELDPYLPYPGRFEENLRPIMDKYRKQAIDCYLISKITSVSNENQNQHIQDPIYESEHKPVKLLSEPWRKSRPNKQKRDKIIWEMRQAGNTWEEISETAKCGETTAKESYKKMRDLT
jgi:hypothetical protein